MIVCLAIFNNRLAAVFESADSYALYQWQQDTCRLLGSVPIAALPASEKSAALSHHCVSLLICGAICGCDMRTLQQSGIDVIPWVCGTIDEVIDALCEQRIDSLRMPGCIRQGANRNECPSHLGLPASAHRSEQHRFRKGCPKQSGNVHRTLADEPAFENEQTYNPADANNRSTPARSSAPSVNIKNTED